MLNRSVTSGLMGCGWTQLWNIYLKRAPHLGGFNKYLDEKIATLPTRPNEDLADFYSRTMTTQKNIELSKAVISTNILIKRYLELLFSRPTIINFLAVKQAFFVIFPSTHGNNSIQK